jgi:glyoxylase-like metal-dependent hydrolase (beta-lactamase superfamily II)
MKPCSHPDSVITVDCHFLQPQRAAAYLIRERDRAAFVDNNTVHAVPKLLEALTGQGLSPEQVQYLIVTHVHLDHAGGTSDLLKHCPQAMVVAHPRAARHLVNPARLMASAERVYGKNALEALYGTMQPIKAHRVRAVEDGERLALGDRILTIIHTRGHANHHICIHDSGSNGVFTGDTFGVSYPAAHRGTPPYLMCSCPPTDFDAHEARASISHIVETGADRVYLAHFGEYSPVKDGATHLFRGLDLMEELLTMALTDGRAGPELEAYFEREIWAATEAYLIRTCGLVLSKDDRHWLESDIHMNALGLAHAVQKSRSLTSNSALNLPARGEADTVQSGRPPETGRR